MKYEVFWVAGERDGEVLKTFDNIDAISSLQAIDFAEEFLREHEEEFDPWCGGVAIIDENGKALEW